MVFTKGCLVVTLKMCSCCHGVNVTASLIGSSYMTVFICTNSIIYLQWTNMLSFSAQLLCSVQKGLKSAWSTLKIYTCDFQQNNDSFYRNHWLILLNAMWPPLSSQVIKCEVSHIVDVYIAYNYQFYYKTLTLSAMGNDLQNGNLYANPTTHHLSTMSIPVPGFGIIKSGQGMTAAPRTAV